MSGKGGRPGRPTRAIVAEARQLEHLALWEAAIELRTSRPRLRVIAQRYGLQFRERPGLSDAQVLEAIREHGFDHTVETLAHRIGAGRRRIARLAEQHQLTLATPRTPKKAGELRYDERGYCRKLCPRCDTWKGAELFASDPSTSSGLHSWCRSCESERDRLRYRLQTLQEAFL